MKSGRVQMKSGIVQMKSGRVQMKNGRVQMIWRHVLQYLRSWRRLGEGEGGGRGWQWGKLIKRWERQWGESPDEESWEGANMRKRKGGHQFVLSWRIRGIVRVSSPHLCKSLKDDDWQQRQLWRQPDHSQTIKKHNNIKDSNDNTWPYSDHPKKHNNNKDSSDNNRTIVRPSKNTTTKTISKTAMTTSRP